MRRGRTERLASPTKRGEREAPPAQEPAQAAAIRGEGGMLGDAGSRWRRQSSATSARTGTDPIARGPAVPPQPRSSRTRPRAGSSRSPRHSCLGSPRRPGRSGPAARPAHQDGGRVRLHRAVADQRPRLHRLRSRDCGWTCRSSYSTMIPVDAGECRGGLQELNLLLDLGRQPLVVVVTEGDEVAGAGFDPGVACPASPAERWFVITRTDRSGCLQLQRVYLARCGRRPPCTRSARGRSEPARRPGPHAAAGPVVGRDDDVDNRQASSVGSGCSADMPCLRFHGSTPPILSSPRRNAAKAPRARSPASAVTLFGVMALALESLRAMGIVIGSTATFVPDRPHQRARECGCHRRTFSMDRSFGLGPITWRLSPRTAWQSGRQAVRGRHPMRRTSSSSSTLDRLIRSAGPRRPMSGSG